MVYINSLSEQRTLFGRETRPYCTIQLSSKRRKRIAASCQHLYSEDVCTRWKVSIQFLPQLTPSADLSSLSVHFVQTQRQGSVGLSGQLKRPIADQDCGGHLEAVELLACRMGQADLSFLSRASVAVARACCHCWKKRNMLQRTYLGPTKSPKLGSTCRFTLTLATSLGDTPRG